MSKRLSEVERAKSDPDELRENAQDFLVLMTCAFDHQLYAQVAHMGNIGLELAVKATYARVYDGVHPRGHNLAKITNVELDSSGSTFFDKIAESSVLDSFNFIKMAWRMQDRYIKRNVSKDTAIAQLSAYKDLIEWTLENYA